MSLTGAPLSFGFKRSFKTQPIKQKEATHKVFISEFGQESGGEGKSAEERVIPKQENSFRPGGGSSFVPRFVPTHVPTSAEKLKSDERFEAAKEVESRKEVRYGLQMRNGGLLGSMASEFVTDCEKEEKDDLDTFRAEVQALPDEADATAYERMPVEDFGLAMLRGMHWKEGEALGKNKDKKAVEAIEYVPRASRLGLGAAPNSVTAKKQRGPVMVLPTGIDGKVRHVRTLDEKLVPYEEARIQKGAKRKIVAGEHKGFQCTVVQSPKSDEGDVWVRLPNDEEIRVQLSELGDTSRTTEEDAHPKYKKRKRTTSSTPEAVSCRKESWLTTGIRVRIVDKDLEKGQLYLKKGVVVDIVSPEVANVVMDHSQSLKNLEESSLETVVPRRDGSTVLIVAGSMKGSKAELLQRKSDSGMVTVQLLSDLTVHQVLLDDVAEYARPQ